MKVLVQRGLLLLLFMLGLPCTLATPAIPTLKLLGRSNVEAYNVLLEAPDWQWLK